MATNSWRPSWRNGKQPRPDVIPNEVEKPRMANSVKSKDLAQRILFYTQNTDLLVRRLVALSQGEIDGTRPADQVRAIELLLDRVFGKAPAVIDIQGEITHKAINDFSDDELRALVDLRNRIIEGEVTPVDDDQD